MMRRTFCFFALLAFANSLQASTDTIASPGIDALTLQLPNGNFLTGATGTGVIGQVEGTRPGFRGFDSDANSSQFISPVDVAVQAGGLLQPNQNVDIHAEEVA